VEQVLALALEARGAVGHDALALGRANLAAEVRLAGFAELALLALWCARYVRPRSCLGDGDVLKRHDVVAGLDVCDALADGLDDTGAFVSENDGERTLRVLTRESVRIWRN
jgi:hypothetical protein